ncbi:hypothetical protein CDO73_02770 [Saccharibacillus sp. O23]|uniref:DUF4179 domain-containing protein n=1 Tax=Saccharibacillus sp. O23 TaxID=2009338 RepID=UPI000B4E0B55|nr:DUF4179 domain-containing protein [Saccharibacillus sp. O23]OWR32544.1 hypothetical protein CDO73_02770 [Saccharibacillus sp. O23]
MNRSETEQHLDLALKSAAKENPPMSPYVRTRLDAAYASLPDTPEQTRTSSATTRQSRRRFSPLRRTAVAAASALVLSTGLFASGFVSPAMADTIRDIPVIGSLFSKIEGDAGLKTAGERNQGSVVQASAAAGDSRMNIKETIFDGTRLAFALELTVPGVKNASKFEEAMENVTLNVVGREMNGFFYTKPTQEGPHTYSVLMNLPLNAADAQKLGQHFEGTVSVTLRNQEQPLTVQVPFKRIGSSNERHLTPGPSVVGARYTLNIDRFDVTASTVQLSTSLKLNDASASAQSQEAALMDIAFEIVDDQGRTLDVVGGQGQLDRGAMRYVSNYGADLSGAKYVIVKPYIRSGDDSGDKKNYLQDLEVKIDLDTVK